MLPESALGAWTPTVERLWRSGLQGLDVTVVAGAVVILPKGYDIVLLELSSRSSRILYRQRMPVPVSMWRPWQGHGIYAVEGAHAYFFGTPMVRAAGIRMAPLICYEKLDLVIDPCAIHGPSTWMTQAEAAKLFPEAGGKRRLVSVWPCDPTQQLWDWSCFTDQE